MKENIKEAGVVMAKCRSSNRPYGIRMEKRLDSLQKTDKDTVLGGISDEIQNRRNNGSGCRNIF